MSLDPKPDWQVVCDAIPLPVVVIGPTESIALLNEPARSLLQSAAVGRHYITALRQPSLLDAIEESIARQVTRTTRYLSSEAGRETTFSVRVVPARLADQQVTLLTFEDITAKEEAGQMRRDFVANVSHELRTPLTALLGFIETLAGAARHDPDAQARFLGIMRREAERMSRLVQDLLSLSRVEQDERVRPTDRVDLRSIIEGSVSALEPLSAEVGCEIELSFPDEPLLLPGDADQLRQVFVNLIENGLKYGRKGGRVTVEVSPSEHQPSLRAPGVKIEVADEGEGIDHFHIARLTERFYRVDSHRSQEMGGTGLGLAIVKHIVNRHRGRLRISSEKGQGSVFSVILPLV